MTAHRNADDLAETDKIQRSIRASLTTIRTTWPHMLHPLKAITYSLSGTHGAPRTSTDDGQHNSDNDVDVSRTDSIISLRADVEIMLNGWCRVVIEDHNVTQTILRGDDIAGLCDFLDRWALQLSEHEAASDVNDELAEAAHACLRAAYPSRRDWKPLGECPVVGDDGERCGGTVRGYADPRRQPECKACGTSNPIDWWERMIFGSDLSRLKTATELVLMIRQQTGRTLKPATVRKWRERGWVTPAHDDEGRPLTDDAGSFLYDAPTVMFSLSWHGVA